MGVPSPGNETDIQQVHAPADPIASAAIESAAVRHMRGVWSAFYAAEDAEDGEEVISPAMSAFCGCEICIAREMLAGAWPAIELYFALKMTAPT